MALTSLTSLNSLTSTFAKVEYIIRTMAKYIKQEMPDLNGTGEKKCYYRLAKSRNISTKEFLNIIARHEMLNVGILEHALSGIADNLAELLAEGYSIKLDGIGTFQATLGVKETKEMDTIDGDEQKEMLRALKCRMYAMCQTKTW